MSLHPIPTAELRLRMDAAIYGLYEDYDYAVHQTHRPTKLPTSTTFCTSNILTERVRLKCQIIKQPLQMPDLEN